MVNKTFVPWKGKWKLESRYSTSNLNPLIDNVFISLCHMSTHKHVLDYLCQTFSSKTALTGDFVINHAKETDDNRPS